MPYVKFCFHKKKYFRFFRDHRFSTHAKYSEKLTFVPPNRYTYLALIVCNQMQSEPCHSSKTKCSAKIVNGWKQTLHLRCLTEFWIRLCVTFNFYLTKLSWEILYFVVSTNAFLLKMQYSNCRVQCWIRPIMSSSEPVRLEWFCSVNNKFVLYFRE